MHEVLAAWQKKHPADFAQLVAQEGCGRRTGREGSLDHLQEQFYNEGAGGDGSAKKWEWEPNPDGPAAKSVIASLASWH